MSATSFFAVDPFAFIADVDPAKDAQPKAL